MRTLIIGDIHGCYDELRDLFDAVALAADDRVVSVGDLVDRGPQPGEVVRWFRERAGAVVIMGNHERKHVRQVFSYSQEITRLQLGDGYADACAWMRGLPYYFEMPEVRVVHAALIPGVPLAEQPEHVLAGTTSGEAELRARGFGGDGAGGWWHEHYTDAVPVVFGHHVVGPEPLVREGKVYGIDTGACHGHRLTALSVPEFRLYSVPARADHWAHTARAYQVAVLRTRPWRTMSWKKIDEKIADFKADGETAPYLDEIAAWAAAVRSLQARMLARVPELAAETEDVESHPAKALLYMHARGRLDADAIAKRCATPAATLELAAKLGIDASALGDVTRAHSE